MEFFNDFFAMMISFEMHQGNATDGRRIGENRLRQEQIRVDRNADYKILFFAQI